MFAAIPTRHGVFRARFSDLGLAELHFPGTFPGVPSVMSSRWSELTAVAVNAILNCERPDEFPPLDLNAHTEFRRRVWAQLLEIPLGATLSYHEVAERLGQRGAARAVGGACGANPIPLIIPCHRVLASGGLLGGFSGGLDWKRKLLSLEGICYTEKGTDVPRAEQEFLALG